MNRMDADIIDVYWHMMNGTLEYMKVLSANNVSIVWVDKFITPYTNEQKR